MPTTSVTRMNARRFLCALNGCLGVPALTGDLAPFLDYLAAQFRGGPYRVTREAGTALVVEHPEAAGLLIAAHADRVGADVGILHVGALCGDRESLDSSGEGFLQGRMDNTVSIAILLEMAERGVPFRAVFCDGEERCVSAPYLMRAVEITGATEVVDIDTDPALYPEMDRRLAEVRSGEIVLRSEEDGAVYDEGLVTRLRRLADENGAAWRTKAGEWLVTQAGSLVRCEGAPGGRFVVAAVGIPEILYHRPTEIASFAAVVGASRVLEALCRIREG